MTNCTFWGNTASTGGGTTHAESATPIFVNCVIGDTSPSVSSSALGAIVTMVHCAVEGGWGGLGENNIAVDPMLVDPDGEDDVQGTVDDDLTLRFGSPCIDAGDGTSLPADTPDLDSDMNVAEDIPLDMVGETRIIGANVDLGPYEFPRERAGGRRGRRVRGVRGRRGRCQRRRRKRLHRRRPKWKRGTRHGLGVQRRTGALLWSRGGQADGDQLAPPSRRRVTSTWTDGPR